MYAHVQPGGVTPVVHPGWGKSHIRTDCETVCRGQINKGVFCSLGSGKRKINLTKVDVTRLANKCMYVRERLRGAPRLRIAVCERMARFEHALGALRAARSTFEQLVARSGSLRSQLARSGALPSQIELAGSFRLQLERSGSPRAF